MRVLAGVVPATEGHGAGRRNRRRAATPLAAKRAVGYCPDVGGPGAARHPLGAPPARRPAAPAAVVWEERGRDLLERFDLGGAAHRVTAGFSHGMGRRLSVVLAALHEPDVLLLDEPFDGVDPLGVEATLEVMADARPAAPAVVVSTHLRELALEACARALVLRGGQRRRDDAGADLAGEEGAGVYRNLLD